jgi:hypothetical protein
VHFERPELSGAIATFKASCRLAIVRPLSDDASAFCTAFGLCDFPSPSASRPFPGSMMKDFQIFRSISRCRNGAFCVFAAMRGSEKTGKKYVEMAY